MVRVARVSRVRAMFDFIVVLSGGLHRVSSRACSAKYVCFWVQEFEKRKKRVRC